MALKAVYDSQEDIPEAHRELYSERDGKWELTGVEGIKTQADVDRVQSALTKERSDHAETKGKLKKFDGIDPEQHAADQTELTELRALKEAGGTGEIDEEKVEKLVEARVATKVAPLNRELEQLKTENTELKTSNEDYANKERVRTISDAVREAAVKGKVIDSAQEDVLMLAERVFEIGEDGSVLTRDNVGVTPGIAPDIWLSEMQDKRPHWWPASTGGGAGGSGSGEGFKNNPFAPDTWNMTEQAKLINTDRPRAERMAQAAGTKIGAPRPPVKASAA